MVLDRKGQVQKVDGSGQWGSVPNKAMEGIELLLEAVEGSGVIGGNPDAQHVVDVTTKEKDIVRKGGKQGLFVDSEEDGGIRRSGGCAHGTSCPLFPICVAKLEDIVAHDKFKGAEQRLDGDVGEFPFVTSEVVTNFDEGRGGLDTRVHGAGVADEDAGAGGKDKL